MPCQNQRETKCTYRIFNEWQLARTNKDPRSESGSLMFDLDKVQRLDINITSMTADSLCFWLTKFIEEVCKQNGERYPARSLYSVVCGLQRHLQTKNGSLAISLLAKDEKR